MPTETSHQSSSTPVPKVAAAGIAGALSVLLTAALNGVGVDLGPEVSAALATLLAFAAGYFTPEYGLSE